MCRRSPGDAGRVTDQDGVTWRPAEAADGRHEPVAAVVAGPHSTTVRRWRERPAGSVDRLDEAAQLGQRNLRDRSPGALHQRIGREAKALRRLIDTGHLVAADEHRDLPHRPLGRIGHGRVFR